MKTGASPEGNIWHLRNLYNACCCANTISFESDRLGTAFDPEQTSNGIHFWLFAPRNFPSTVKIWLLVMMLIHRSYCLLVMMLILSILLLACYDAYLIDLIACLLWCLSICLLWCLSIWGMPLNLHLEMKRGFKILLLLRIHIQILEEPPHPPLLKLSL